MPAPTRWKNRRELNSSRREKSGNHVGQKAQKTRALDGTGEITLLQGGNGGDA